MPHLEHDRLVFLALGETEPDVGESDHLTACPLCRAEVETLRHIGTIGAQTQGLADLPEPDDRVWQGIVSGIESAAAAPATNGRGAAVPLARESSRPTAPPVPPTPAAPPVQLRRRRRWGAAVTAVAAATAGVVATIAVVRAVAPDPAADPTVVASAALAAFGSTPQGAGGEARVFADGRLHLHTAGLPRVPGYYQVWLIDPDTMRMVPVGTLGDAADVLMPLPTNVDLDTYRLVDVSAEEYDDDPTHSGDSLLRGTLSG
ncbi:anti-sigma factor [Micromonospora sp. NBC_01813]|uniref:anti-sigma factor n=1 Tax=Micromonospora sp. NBC_01813 TaxID=2975988 RepID=UPI002DDC40EC|nr:anti-sigma factor [Micromonospora sp. NBC_01813]WSA11929.1 anti-sigma factor [Micromonospora sp. NBC_01813]